MPRGQGMWHLGMLEDLSRGRPPLAVVAPLLDEHGLEFVSHEVGAVAELRGSHGAPETLAQGGQTRQVVGELHCLGNVILLRLRHQAIKAQRRQQCHTHTGAMRVAPEADHWHSHEQGLATRSGVGVREGVESNVYFVVGVEVVEGAIGERDEPETMGGHAETLKVLNEDRLHIGGVKAFRLHEEATVRHLAEHAGPECHHLRVDLGQASEAAEGDAPLAGGRQGTHVGDVTWRRVAQEAAGQADKLLREQLLAVGRVHHRIGDSVVHSPEARGVVVANVGELHRRRLQSHHVEAIVGRMTRELDKDVDSIFTDQARHFMGWPASDFLPMPFFNHGTEQLCLVVFSCRIRVEEDFELLPVAVLDEAMAEKGHRVMEEVGGEVAYA
mmetsp:Transcript_55815/g.122550  ORF Transcript_55815/g.122550 Transcript_55815/m.122550 type:complete len:385 (-) Transcript_55815:1080-2234(-)